MRLIKTALGAVGLALPITFFFGLAALWAVSYQAPHSLRYSRGVGQIQVLADRGLFQIDLVQGDTTDRGFEWDAHRRSASWGRTCLKTFGSDTGATRVLANLGFGGWAYSRRLGSLFGPGLEGRVLFLPFWFVILFPGILLAWQVRTGAFARTRIPAQAGDVDERHSRARLLTTPSDFELHEYAPGCHGTGVWTGLTG